MIFFVSGLSKLIWQHQHQQHAVSVQTAAPVCPSRLRRKWLRTYCRLFHHHVVGRSRGKSLLNILDTHLIWIFSGSSILPSPSATAAVGVLHAAFGRFGCFLLTHTEKWEKSYPVSFVHSNIFRAGPLAFLLGAHVLLNEKNLRAQQKFRSNMKFLNNSNINTQTIYTVTVHSYIKIQWCQWL